MKFVRTTFCLLAVVAVFGMSTTANAQDNQNNQNAAGNTTGTGPLDLGAGPDTSAFDTIDRGTVPGGSVVTGFGPAATQNAAGGGFGGGGGGGGFGGLGGLGGLFGGNGGGFGGGAGNTAPRIRTRLRSAIEVTPMASGRVEQVANQRIVQIPQRHGLGSVNVSMQGRVATITGTVTTEKQRRMSELLMRLEPGVSSVQNNVIVTPTFGQ